MLDLDKISEQASKLISEITKEDFEKWLVEDEIRSTFHENFIPEYSFLQSEMCLIHKSVRGYNENKISFYKDTKFRHHYSQIETYPPPLEKESRWTRLMKKRSPDRNVRGFLLGLRHE